MKIKTYSLLTLAGWLLACGMFDPIRGQESGNAALSTTGGFYGEKTGFIISKIDAAAAEEFRKAWEASGNGFTRLEALVLVYKADDGSISARWQGKTNERDRVTFGWTADILAVVHTHPNDDDPKPSGADLRLADRFRVPVFTITQGGMFVYDPETRKISMVQNRLDWRKSSKWHHEGQAVIAPKALR